MSREIFNPEKGWVPSEKELNMLEMKKREKRGLSKEEESRLEVLRKEEKFLKDKLPREPSIGQYL